MSLRSPSLISDSGSLSTSEGPHDILHFNQLTESNTALQYFSSRPNCETHSVRSRVSKLEEDKSHLEDYATGLQNRIQHIRQQRLEMHHTSTRLMSSRPIDSNSFDTAFVSTSIPSTTTNQLNAKPSSSHRQYHSLSAATSAGTTGTLSSAGVENVKATELAVRFQETSVGISNSHRGTMTPTRRCLQAIQQLFSSEASSLLSSENMTTPIGKSGNGLSQSISISKPQCMTQDKNGDVLKTPASKVDSVIFTSKLVPRSTSQSKMPILAAASNCPSMTPISTIVNLPKSPSEVNDGVPNKYNKKNTFKKRPDPEPLKSSIQEESRTSDPPSSMGKLGNKPRNRVSFSNPPHHGQDPEKELSNGSERVGRVWGSWSKKSPPSSLTSSNFKENGSPSSATSVSALSFLFSKSQMDNAKPQAPDSSAATPKIRRRSLAPQCLRQLMKNASESSALDQQTHEIRQTDSRPGTSLSRSDSRQSIGKQAAKGELPKEKKISPSRVGSPILRTRVPDLSTGVKLERTHSMRTTGKYGERDKGISLELARRRTIHPMFSFERPSSAEPMLQESTSIGSIKTDGGRTEPDAPSSKEKQGNSRKKTKVSTMMASQPTPSPDNISVQQSAALDQSTVSGHSTRAETARSDVNSAGSSIPLMRTRIGAASHGTFAFEPAAAIVFEPRSRPIPGPTLVRTSANARFPLRLAVIPQLQHTLPKQEKEKGKNDVAPDSPESYPGRQARLYDEFCRDLKAILGEGGDWSSFMNYARRYDLGVLSADVLLQRVKRLIDGRRSVQQATRTMLYEKFAKIVQDNS